MTRGDSEVRGGRVPPPNAQTYPSLSGGFPSVPSGIKGLQQSISFDYQTGLINGSFFSILSN